MFKNVRLALLKHIRENSTLYFFLSLVFVVGISAGAFTVNGLSVIQRDELANYLKGFLALFETQAIDNSQLFKISIMENLKIVLVLWLLGATIIGIPFIFILMGVRGFITGFTVGFIVKIMGVRGVLFSISTLLLKEIIIIPCMIALGVNGIKFSMNIIKKKSIKRIYKESFKIEFISYCMFTLFFSSIILLGILMEAYVSPVLIRMIYSIINP